MIIHHFCFKQRWSRRGRRRQKR